MIGGGFYIVDDDIRPFAISAIRSCDAQSEGRSPLYGGNVSLSFNINPP